jgi:hypothetical protein
MMAPRVTAPDRPRAVVRVVALVALATGLELAARSVARLSLLQAGLGLDMSGPGVVAVALVVGAAAIAALWRAGGLVAKRTTAVLLLCAFPSGMAAQLSLGARLQSDGFYYFAHLRSLWFDHDQDLTNDYRMLGMGDKANLFTPTPTGYAQSAWTIGPAIVWAPFFAVGDGVAHLLRAHGRDVSVDGTSYPYRQSVCVAGLVWGLVGLYFCFLLASRFAPGAWAALGTILVASGSFILWYLVKEPTMTHAPSMAAVSAFTWAWAATRGRRSMWQWAALGLLAGFMGTIRWQNLLLALLPAVEWTATTISLVRTNHASAIKRHVARGLLFSASAVVGFAPQMFVWRAIYGTWFAVSPIGPQIRWWSPQLADVLWSSRNGLFATSPILYVGALGLLLCWRRDRLFAAAALIAFGAMVFFNASIQDWWGSAAFGGRRFDGTLPLLVVGAAIAAQTATVIVARWPQAAIVAAGSALVVWNLTFMSAALEGVVRIGEPIAFGPLAAYQVMKVEHWTGHPFSWPANLWFAWRNGVSPGDYDLLRVLRFLADPARPYGRIDIGADDAIWVGDGWLGPERTGDITYRWATSAASLRLVLDQPAALRVQMRLRAFSWPGAPPQQLIVIVNGTAQPSAIVPPDWTVVEATVPPEAWRAGVNVLTLAFARETRPADVGVSSDTRGLAAAVDYVRVAVEAP